MTTCRSMRIDLLKPFLFFIVIILLTSCATQRTSTIVGGEYNMSKDKTEYFVLPYGSVVIPGKWEKSHYNTTSRQQFFKNQDSVCIAISFSRFNKYEFNKDGSLREYNFVKAYYDWDSQYFIDSHGFKRLPLVCDSTNKYMIYRIYGQIEKGNFDTYFLIGEKNGNISNYSISSTDKWTEVEKLNFLINLFLTENKK